MKDIESTLEAKGEIIEKMEKTFNFRNSWIKKKNPGPDEIIEDYPKLLDFNGQLVGRFYCFKI